MGADSNKSGRVSGAFLKVAEKPADESNMDFLKLRVMFESMHLPSELGNSNALSLLHERFKSCVEDQHLKPEYAQDGCVFGVGGVGDPLKVLGTGESVTSLSQLGVKLGADGSMEMIHRAFMTEGDSNSRFNIIDGLEFKQGQFNRLDPASYHFDSFGLQGDKAKLSVFDVNPRAAEKSTNQPLVVPAPQRGAKYE